MICLICFLLPTNNPNLEYNPRPDRPRNFSESSWLGIHRYVQAGLSLELFKTAVLWHATWNSSASQITVGPKTIYTPCSHTMFLVLITTVLFHPNSGCGEGGGGGDLEACLVGSGC